MFTQMVILIPFDYKLSLKVSKITNSFKIFPEEFMSFLLHFMKQKGPFGGPRDFHLLLFKTFIFASSSF